MKNALFVIDPQADFCQKGDGTHPQGSLFVEGADEDMKRLASFLKVNSKSIDSVIVTLDSHGIIDIAHPAFWRDKDGNQPPPFTPITAKEIQDGVWTANLWPAKALKYVQDLEASGGLTHLIWPVHCIIGTRGSTVYEPLMDEINNWAATGKFPQFVTKGTNPLTEHFGALMAQVPIANSPETQFNMKLINVLETFNNVFLAGEAKSHCVGTTLKQVIDNAPQLIAKFTIIEDCMSDVTGFAGVADPIFDQAKKLGAKFINSSTQI